MHGKNDKTSQGPVCLKVVRSLKSHQRNIHSNKYHKCNHCEKWLRLGSMRNHVNNVHKKDLNFKCEICSMTFYNNHKLTRHKSVVHKEEKNYKCEICKETFSKQDSVNNHFKKIHIEI